MAPTVFYRVEDEHSSARYSDGEGIFAGTVSIPVDFTKKNSDLRHQVALHLDWSNRQPTPFISVYSDKLVARREAERRLRSGKTDVRIYTIDTYVSSHRMEYRNIRLLAKKLGLFIPQEAWHNSEHEYIFLDYVWEGAIVERTKYKLVDIMKGDILDAVYDGYYT